LILRGLELSSILCVLGVLGGLDQLSFEKMHPGHSRWNKPHLLKLSKEAHQHLLGLNPLVKTETP
jgi:hypothetical protein